MPETAVIIGVVILGIILFFGASYIITAAEKTSPVINSIIKDTNTRCDTCLKQFEADGVSCDHTSKDRICVALSNYYCVANCSVNLQGNSATGKK
jgi:hypothetical protein